MKIRKNLNKIDVKFTVIVALKVFEQSNSLTAIMATDLDDPASRRKRASMMASRDPVASATGINEVKQATLAIKIIPTELMADMAIDAGT